MHPSPDDSTSSITVSPFDYSIENHFNAMNTIHKLCTSSSSSSEAIDEIELQELSSRITFLREWKGYFYADVARTVRFSCDVEGQQRKHVLGEVSLPQFSAATVPKMEGLSTDSRLEKMSDDFVLHVGGHVWALDWCPTVRQRPDCHVKCEYLAVSVHPPGSSYHKIGDPLTGSGAIQIWCVVHAVKKEESPSLSKIQRKNRKIVEKKDTLPSKKPRGGPKAESLDDPQPSKKARGNPEMLNNVQRYLVASETEGESVAPLAIAASLVSTPRPSLVETTMNMDKQALTKGTGIDLGLGSSNRENQIDQATHGQFDNRKDKKLLTCEEAGGKPKKARGRPKKGTKIKKSLETMVTENKSIISVAIDGFLVPSGFDKHTPLIDCNNMQLKTTKAGGSYRNQKKKETLVNVGTEHKSVLALTEATRCMEGHITPKSYSEHVGSCDSNIKSQVGEATPAEAFNAREYKPPSPKKMRWGATKKKNMNEPIVDLSTEEYFPLPPATGSPLCYAGKSTRVRRLRKQKDMKDFVVYPENVRKFVPALATEASQVLSDIPSPTKVTWSREACVSPQISDTDFELEIETLNSYRRRKTKKKKEKIQTGSCADGISSPVMGHWKDRDSSPVLQNNKDSFRDVITPIKAKNGSLEVNTGSCDPPSKVALPRVFVCLAHNGKVAWDVKWRPPSMPDAVHKNCLRYLAVVLGNGFIEVWEVPSATTIEVLHSSGKKESTDPRLLKLEPVFRCSKLMSGDRHSIPLTVEWSTSSPHDLLLAGFHDGTVALWKFSSSGFSQDTRPLLSFSADTHPIRALAWAPDGSDEESANIVVTAGHGSAHFWDIRDPYRPLGELTHVRRFIYSLDWLQDPSCVLLSFDDGTLRCWSLSKAACDVPVTGKPLVGTQLGLHTYFCSSSPIWSVQASRVTGQVVYCGADGSALHFQLTAKAVDKDSSRYRAPHFLCGSLIEEDAGLTVNSPLPKIPFPLRKSNNDLGEVRSINALLSDLNQAKRPNDETLGDGILALCHNKDPSFEFDYEERMCASKAKTTSKASKRKNPDNLEKGENQEVRSEMECLPSKIVAMHRVRWNMNKGSERWVCYGGAAGIVRCQEICP